MKKKYHVLIYLDGENYRTGVQYRIMLDDEQFNDLKIALREQEIEDNLG